MTSSTPFQTIAIIGVGLMGASLAGALKNLPEPPVIRGSTPDRREGEKALERGLIDVYTPVNRDATAGAELIVVATPPSRIPEVWEEISSVVPPETLLTDMASVKLALYDLYRKKFVSSFPRYLSCHPMAGREVTGVDSARADLFRDRLTFLVPFSPSPRQEDIDRLTGLWSLAGSPRLTILEAREHDRILALISHLPHILSFAMLQTLTATSDRGELSHWDWPSQKGGALKDMLRIAWSSPDLWGDILIQNRTELLASMQDFNAEMEQFRQALVRENREEMTAYLKKLQSRARKDMQHENHP